MMDRPLSGPNRDIDQGLQKECGQLKDSQMIDTKKQLTDGSRGYIA